MLNIEMKISMDFYFKNKSRIYIPSFYPVKVVKNIVKKNIKKKRKPN